MGTLFIFSHPVVPPSHAQGKPRDPGTETNTKIGQ